MLLSLGELMTANVPPTENHIGSILPSLSQLLSYLHSWQDSNGLYNGIIATWWSSYAETAVAHPMNQFPIILGFLELHEARVSGGQWLEEARRVGDGLIGTIQPDGLLRNGWGDIPGRGTGTIFFAAAALALAELYRHTGDARHLDGSTRLLATIEKHWSLRGLNSDAVANQGLKWAEAMITLHRITGDVKCRDHALQLGRAYLDQQIPSGPMAGGVFQSRSDDRLIGVYQGKCITPWVRLYEATGETPFLHAAQRLGDFLVGQTVDQGLFMNYAEPTGGLHGVIHKNLRRLDYRVFRRRLPLYRVWRSAIGSWQRIEYPSFIARGAESIRGLRLLANVSGRFAEPAASLAQRFVSFQLPHGGFPNSVGYLGDPGFRSWQDRCSPLRWNAYAFLLLTSFVKGFDDPEMSLTPMAYPPGWFEEPLSGQGNLYRESAEVVELIDGGQVAARIWKASGRAEVLSPQYKGEITTERSAGYLQKGSGQ